MGLLGEWREPDEEPDKKLQPWMTKDGLNEWLNEKPEGLRGVYRSLGPDPDHWYGSVLPLKYGPEEGGIDRLRTALPQAIRAPLLGLLDLAAATKTGVLTPEALNFLTMIPLGPAALIAPRGSLAMGGSRKTPSRNVQPPSIRDRSLDEAIRIAREEPHLIESGKGSGGLYADGPPNVKSYEDLQSIRRQYDKGVEAGAAGADFFPRTRENINEVTGGNPLANKWMSHQHAMFSGGVSPENELAFTLRENNASIAGMPQRAFRQWQHNAHLEAVENKDPLRYPLGYKTGPYQKHIEPPPPGANFDPRDTATGVNDFRVAGRFGYTDPYNLTPTQHAFIDHESALAVDRARRANLAGRSDWTGEGVQAAGWVNDKKESILRRQPRILGDRLEVVEKRAAAEGLGSEEKAALIAQARAEADAEALAMAKRTIGDYFPKHTAYDIYPLIPREQVPGHMTGLASAGANLRAAYAADPRSTSAIAPRGRDALYAGTGIPDTGVSMRVRPTTAISREVTEVARPLVAFQTEGPNKVMPVPDRTLLDTLSFTRGAIDALPETHVIKTWDGGDVGKTNAVRFNFHRPLSEPEKAELSQRMKAHGLPEIVDTGEGVVAANFTGGPIDMDKLTAVQRDLHEVLPGTKPMRTYAEQVHNDLQPLFAKGEGSGAVTDELLRQWNSNPAIREAFDHNPYLPQMARARAERDQEWGKILGAPRQDIQNLRNIIGEGPGASARLEQARRTGSESLPSRFPVPVGPPVGGNPPVRGEAGLSPYIPIWVDDLPKMTDAGRAEQARELIGKSVDARVQRQRQEWLRKNAPVQKVLIRRDLIA